MRKLTKENLGMSQKKRLVRGLRGDRKAQAQKWNTKKGRTMKLSSSQTQAHVISLARNNLHEKKNNTGTGSLEHKKPSDRGLGGLGNQKNSLGNRREEKAVLGKGGSRRVKRGKNRDNVRPRTALLPGKDIGQRKQ